MLKKEACSGLDEAEGTGWLLRRSLRVGGFQKQADAIFVTQKKREQRIEKIA